MVLNLICGLGVGEGKGERDGVPANDERSWVMGSRERGALSGMEVDCDRESTER